MGAKSNVDEAMALTRHPFTLEAYERMIERGILTKDDRVELLAGEVVEMSPIGDRHFGGVNRIARVLFAAFGELTSISVQGPIAFPPASMPQPDVALLKKRGDDYYGGRPLPKDVLLLVEVADSSLLIDRKIKVPLYAAAAIPEVWILNLAAPALEVYTVPSSGRYTRQIVFTRDDASKAIAPVSCPDIDLRIADLLPP